jgi:hypothetical protein
MHKLIEEHSEGSHLLSSLGLFLASFVSEGVMVL